MKILVTGGAGFIGSHIVKLLLDQGHTVLVFDNLSRGYLELIDKRALFLKGDLADSKLLEKALVGIDGVIHMAALAEVNESVSKPLLYVQNNIVGSLNLLEAMRVAGVKKIIFSSSCTVYGFARKLPITEGAPILAVNPYGATKVAVESFLSSYHYVHGFDVVILRYFNPYGPNDQHQPETHAIANFTRAALEDRPLPLYWQGEQVRDFIYVEDLARAHIDVLDLRGWNVFNVGTEKGVKVKDAVKTIEKILGKRLKIEDLGERPGDVPASFASSKKLMKATSWKPKYSLEEGLKKTIDWFKGRVKNG